MVSDVGSRAMRQWITLLSYDLNGQSPFGIHDPSCSARHYCEQMCNRIRFVIAALLCLLEERGEPFFELSSVPRLG